MLNFQQPLFQSSVSHGASEFILILIWFSRNIYNYYHQCWRNNLG